MEQCIAWEIADWVRFAEGWEEETDGFKIQTQVQEIFRGALRSDKQRPFK